VKMLTQGTLAASEFAFTSLALYNDKNLSGHGGGCEGT